MTEWEILQKKDYVIRTQGCVYAREELVELIVNSVLKDTLDHFQTASVNIKIFL